jgi:hypothetical protein
VLAAALGWIAWQQLWAHGSDTRLAWIDLTSRTLAQPAHAGLRVFRAREPLVRELGTGGRSATVPPIDFGRRTAILVSSGPRSSTAFELVLVTVVEERRRIVVTVRERTPSLADPGTATLTFPFRLITIERSRKPVTLDWEGRP